MIRTRTDLGRTLGDARRRRGITQAELARRIGTSGKNVSNWENDHTGISVDALLRVLDALNHHLAVTDRRPRAKPEPARGIPIHSPAQAGNLIHEIRIMQRVSGRELAAAIDVSEGCVSRWNGTDTPSLDSVIKAAEALGWQLAFVPKPEEDA